MRTMIHLEKSFLDAQMLAFRESIAGQEPSPRKRWVRAFGAATNLTVLYTFVKNGPISNLDVLGLDLFFGSYGKYCGPGWCGGKEQSEKQCACSENSFPEPDNKIAACCKTHDLCLGGGGSRECDDALCECLTGLDPANEPVPPGSSLDRQIGSYYKMRGYFYGTRTLWH